MPIVSKRCASLSSRSGQVALVWYLHQPWCIDDGDVHDFVRETLSHILAIHRDTSTPVTLAITGALLDRLVRIAPGQIAEMASLVESGLGEIAGTFYHEAFPHFLEPGRILSHIRRDSTLKHSLFGRSPRGFFPANLAWTPALGPILAREGFQRVILDGPHLPLAGAMQGWKWDALGPTAPLHPAALPSSAIQRLWTLHGEDGPLLDVVFRDVQAVNAVSFGDAGAIHRPFDAEAQRHAMNSLHPRQGIVALADDADRVNSVSVVAYRRLLAGCDAEFARLGDLCGERRGRLDHLPGYAIGDIGKFWLSGPDGHHWLKVLDEVHRRHPDPDDPEVMSLHDVYPLFWRCHWRTRRFWEKALGLLR